MKARQSSSDSHEERLEQSGVAIDTRTRAMSQWCDPLVTRLASKTVQLGDCCGFVVVCSWPMPSVVVEKYT
eukprot:1211903-Amphidinium_carterae.1